MLRTITRLGVPGRLRNPYYSAPQNAPNPTQEPSYQQLAAAQQQRIRQQQFSAGVSPSVALMPPAAATASGGTLLFPSGTPGLSQQGNTVLFTANPAEYQKAQTAVANAQSDITRSRAIMASMQNQLNTINFNAMPPESAATIFNALNGNYMNAQKSIREDIGVVQQEQAQLALYGPVPVATISGTTLTALPNATVSQAVFGTVNGATQQLGTLAWHPAVSGTTLSFTNAGWTPSVVTVGGQGWSAGLLPTYDAATGQIALNPRNYSYVEGTPTAIKEAGATYTYGAPLPAAFGLAHTFAGSPALPSLTGGLMSATNIQLTGTLTSPGGSVNRFNFYENYNPGTGYTAAPQKLSLFSGLPKGYNAQVNPVTGSVSISAPASTTPAPQFASPADKYDFLLSLESNMLNQVQNILMPKFSSQPTPQTTSTPLSVPSTAPASAPATPEQAIENLVIAKYTAKNKVIPAAFGVVVSSSSATAPETPSEALASLVVAKQDFVQVNSHPKLSFKWFNDENVALTKEVGAAYAVDTTYASQGLANATAPIGNYYATDITPYLSPSQIPVLNLSFKGLAAEKTAQNRVIGSALGVVTAGAEQALFPRSSNPVAVSGPLADLVVAKQDFVQVNSRPAVTAAMTSMPDALYSNPIANPIINVGTGIISGVVSTPLYIVELPGTVLSFATNPEATAFGMGAAMYKSVATNPEYFAGQLIGSVDVMGGATDIYKGLNPTPDFTTATNIRSAIQIGASPSDSEASVIVSSRDTTGLGALDYYKAQPKAYLPGAPAEPGFVATPEYEVSFKSPGVSYAINPATKDFIGAYSKAARTVQNALLGTENSGTLPVIGGSAEVPVEMSDVGFTGTRSFDIQGGSVTQSFSGVTRMGATKAGDVAYGSGEATGDVTTTVKFNTPLRRLFRLGPNEITSTAPISSDTGLINMVTKSTMRGGETALNGRTLPYPDEIVSPTAPSTKGFSVTEVGPTKFGKAYSGFIYNSPGKIETLQFYEVSSPTALTGFSDIAEPTPAEAWAKLSGYGKPPKPYIGASDIVSASPGATASAPATEAAVTAQTSVSLFKFAPDLKMPVMQSSMSGATAPLLYSSVGVDPAVLMATQTRQQGITSTRDRISAWASLTGLSTNSIGAQRLSDTLKNSSVLGTGLSNALVNSNASASATAQGTADITKNVNATDTLNTLKNPIITPQKMVSTPMQAQKQVQKQAQKQVQTQIFNSNIMSIGFASASPPTMPWGVPYVKRKPNKRKSPSHAPRKPLVFGYSPDVESSLLKMHGNPKRKKFYQATGLSRPIV